MNTDRTAGLSPDLSPDLPSDLTAALERFFGFPEFRPGQERVMRTLLDGASSAAVFPTGGGKSLCYQLPALLLPGVTVVVSPLIALMKDQLDALRARDLPAARLDSTLELEEYRQVMGDLRSGRLKLLYVAPERFVNERFRQALGQVRLSMLAVDEAHCVSEWGHNFRPDYLKLADHAGRLGAERVLALTATATPKVLADICRTFDIADENAVRTGFYRPNLELLTVPAPAAERDRLLVERVTSRPQGPGIVYVTLRRTAERVTDLLRGAGVEARVYHAGVKSEERARTQEDFLASDRMIVVATIAFGMGIDKSDLRYVDHYDLPKSLENWAQEIGRAGRDGAPSTCTLLACPDSLAALRNFAHGDVPDADAVRGLVGEVFGETEAADDHIILDLYGLGVEHDLRPLVVRTLLTYLELDGRIEAGTPLYDVYRFKPLATSGEILARFQGERREFLAALFRQATKRRTWLDIDLSEASAALGAPRERLVRALDYLAEQGLLELKASKLRNPYRIVQRPDDLDALAASLHERTLALEARELERIDQVLELAALDGCRWNALCEHFGEERDRPCGHCSYCLDGEARPLPEPAPRPIDDALWRQAEDLRRSREEVLGAPRAFARFLVGLSSPRLSRARLGGHPLFGALADVPFADVLERATSGAPVSGVPNDAPADA